MNKERNKGITLIALVITIIVKEYFMTKIKILVI